MKKGEHHLGKSRQRIAASMKGRRNAVGNEGGRPLRYRSEYAYQVYCYCLLGAIDSQLAKIFGVSLRTLNNWKRLYPDFREEMYRGKTIADAKVANALFRSACGYEYVEDKIFGLRDTNGELVIHVIPVQKHLPPNATALKFWLTNRAPHYWSHQPQQVDTRPDALYIRRDMASGEIVLEKEAEAIS